MFIQEYRSNPHLWQPSYLSLRSYKRVFMDFRDLVLAEKKQFVVDVGCGYKPWRNLFPNDLKYIGVDNNHNYSSADVVASAEKLPFPDGSVDALIYSEVLEHIQDISTAIQEMRRVAKDGALIFISSPFVFYEHGAPFDFRRLTRFFYQQVFNQDKFIVCKVASSSLASALVTINLAIESSPLVILWGIKHIFYISINIVALLVDSLVTYLGIPMTKLIEHLASWCLRRPVRFVVDFYALSLGYSMIIRINKSKVLV